MRQAREEQKIQRAIVAHLKARATKGTFWFAVPNGGARSPIEAAIMKGTGTRAGVPDLFFLRQGRSYFLEVKAIGGRTSPAQFECMDQINNAGGEVFAAEGLDACLRILEAWGLLKGTSA